MTFSEIVGTNVKVITNSLKDFDIKFLVKEIMTVFHAFSSFLFKQFQTAFLLSFMHFHHFSIVVACVFFHITVVSLLRLLCSIPSFILWILMLSLFVVCVLIPTGSSSQDWESVLGLFSRFVLFFFLFVLPCSYVYQVVFSSLFIFVLLEGFCFIQLFFPYVLEQYMNIRA